MLGRLFNKISGAGLMLALIGTLLLAFSLRDTVISFKAAKSFDDVLSGDVAAGDHVAGRVPYLLDSRPGPRTGPTTPERRKKPPPGTMSCPAARAAWA